MSRRIRPFAAAFALVAFVFAQLATAAYACPQVAAPAMSAMAADCDHGSNPEPNLCDDGKVSVDTVKSLSSPAAAPAYARPILPAAREGVARAARCAPLVTGPPASRFTVLRI
jgi:hypothetical protein